MSNFIIEKTQVVVHPLVLLSSVDHFTRVYGVSSLSLQAGRRKRVVGALLGSTTNHSSPSLQCTINITNSFAGTNVCTCF